MDCLERRGKNWRGGRGPPLSLCARSCLWGPKIKCGDCSPPRSAQLSELSRWGTHPQQREKKNQTQLLTEWKLTRHSILLLISRCAYTVMVAWAGQNLRQKSDIGATVDVAFQDQAFCNPPIGKMETSPRLPPARPSPDRRLIAGVKLIKVPSCPRRHRNWHSPHPHLLSNVALLHNQQHRCH